MFVVRSGVGLGVTSDFYKLRSNTIWLMSCGFYRWYVSMYTLYMFNPRKNLLSLLELPIPGARVTPKPNNSLKGIPNSIPRKPDNPFKGI